MCREKSVPKHFRNKSCAVRHSMNIQSFGLRHKCGNLRADYDTGPRRNAGLSGSGTDCGFHHKDDKRFPACHHTDTIFRQAGFSIISAIFLLVVLSALAAFIVNISSGQHVSAAADVRGAQAYQAARAGIEWGAYQVLDPNSAAASATAAACPGATTFSPFTGFSVSVTCASSTHTENGNNISVYKFSSVATSGTAGTIDYVQRQMDVTVAKCTDPAAAAPFVCE